MADDEHADERADRKKARNWMTDEIPEALKRNIESPRSTDRESRVTALSMALSTYAHSTVTPAAILALASHYADFIIKGEIEWPEDVNRGPAHMLPKQQEKP